MLSLDLFPLKSLSKSFCIQYLVLSQYKSNSVVSKMTIADKQDHEDNKEHTRLVRGSCVET